MSKAGPKFGTVRWCTKYEKGDQWHLIRFAQLQAEGLWYDGKLIPPILTADQKYDVDAVVAYASVAQDTAREQGESLSMDVRATEEAGASMCRPVWTRRWKEVSAVVRPVKMRAAGSARLPGKSVLKKSGFKIEKERGSGIVRHLRAIANMPAARLLAILDEALLRQQNSLVSDTLSLTWISFRTALAADVGATRVHWPRKLPLSGGNTDKEAYLQAWVTRDRERRARQRKRLERELRRLA